MAVPLSAFTVRCLRHPSHHPDAYSSATHRYRSSYVRPDVWLLQLDASGPVRVRVTGDAPDDLPRAEPEDRGEVRVPAAVRSYRWRVERLRGGEAVEVAALSTGRTPTSVVEVPTEGRRTGRFRVSLTVALTGAPALSASRTFEVQDYLLVSLGDSYASGEGNPDDRGWHTVVPGLPDDPGLDPRSWVPELCSLTDEPRWQEAAAHRSYLNGPSIAAARLQSDGGPGLVSGVARVLAPTFVSVASSGATVAQLSRSRQHSWQPRGGQVREARAAVGDRPVDAVLISAGGNDAGFADQLEALARDDLELKDLPGIVLGLITGPLWATKVIGWLGLLDGDAVRRAARRAITQAMTSIEQEYRRLAPVVDEELAPRLVVVTGYPVHLFENDRGGEGACGVFDVGPLGVDADDIALITELGTELNAAIGRAVAEIDAGREGTGRPRWVFVDGVDEAFRRRGYCARFRYLRQLAESCQRQGDIDGTMHPNVDGHRAYADLISGVLRERLVPRGPRPDLVRPDLDLDRTTLDFGTRNPGELVIQHVRVTNSGEAPLTFTTAARRGWISWPAMRTTLRPGASTQVPVRFLAAAPGGDGADLRIESDSPASPHLVRITGRARSTGSTSGTGPRPGGDGGPIHTP